VSKADATWEDIGGRISVEESDREKKSALEKLYGIRHSLLG